MLSSLAPRRLQAVVGCLVLLAVVTGCAAAAPSDPSGGISIVLGARANMPATDLHGLARQVAHNAVDTRSPVSVVVADGAPFVVDDARLTAPQRGGGAVDGPVPDRAALRDAVVTATARSPESDLLGALELAARAVESTPGRHTILVLDSGLSTTGALDFRQRGLIDAYPADLVASLRTAGTLPDLSGNRVVFAGLGYTAAPQPALSAAAREQLIDLWTAIALAAGALEVHVERAASTGEPRPGLPPVSVVGPGGGVSCSENMVVLDGGDVAFEADTARFKDPAAAAATLKPIADSMTTADTRATLTGTTADVGSKEGQLRLSQERAQAVADLLGELGVRAENMDVAGLGSDFPGYVHDRDGTGNLSPSAAALNRRVIIELSGVARTLACG